MNVNRLLSITTLALVLLFTSCKKDDESSSNPEIANYFLNAKVDGIDFSTSNVLVSASALTTDFYTITAVEDAGNSITFTLVGIPNEGTYSPIEGDEVTSFYYGQSNPSGTWFAIEDTGSGSITISNISATAIQGSFSFTGELITDSTSTKNITEGTFNARRL